MEDIVTYVVIFGLIIVGVAVWQYRSGRGRPYILSSQIFPELQLQILVRKKPDKEKDLIVEVVGKKDLTISKLSLEMISRKREFHSLDVASGIPDLKLPLAAPNNQPLQFAYPFSTLKDLMKQSEFRYRSFRMVVENEAGKKFKSHELAFNKNWGIFKPDTGNYN